MKFYSLSEHCIRFFVSLLDDRCLISIWEIRRVARISSIAGSIQCTCDVVFGRLLGVGGDKAISLMGEKKRVIKVVDDSGYNTSTCRGVHLCNHTRLESSFQQRTSENLRCG